MKIDILDYDRLIEVNKLEEVTSPRIFSTKMTFDPDGLLSNEIFGISKADRKTTFAWINLRRKFIHPHIYHQVLKMMFRNIVNIISGQKYFSINEHGLLVEDPEKGWTGLQNLYEHWDQIQWQNMKSANTTGKNILANLKRDQIFIDKLLVIPPFYRDVLLSGTMDSSDYVNELNNLYTRLIRSIALLNEGGLFARTQYNTQYKIQTTIDEIMMYFRGLISRKNGLIRKNLMGKSVDYGVRSVISSPTYCHENFQDNIIDMEHIAVPISMCCSTFYPFIVAWLRNFFTREIVNQQNSSVKLVDENGKDIFYTPIIESPELQFSEKRLHKLINDYCLNPDNRYSFIQVKIQTVSADGRKALTTATVNLKGIKVLPNNIQEVLQRPMTVTDLLYLACVDVCEKRHGMVSRYPVGTDKGIYFAKINVNSTRNKIKLIYNGKEYPRYPDIDIKMDKHKVGVQFIDTLIQSNAHLDGMGAD